MKVWFYFLLFFITFYSCARIGSPTGGIKDETPPKVLSVKPLNNSTNISADLKRITINFNEYILLKNPNEQVTISPIFKEMPEFKPTNSPKKSITIDFKEPLTANTTYVINFGNSITDNSEGNILPYLNYVFSTGSKIDSLEVSGKIIDFNASNESEKENLLVGLYKMNEQYKDSIITKEKPLYLTRPSKENEFNLKYIQEGKYRLIAFSDINKNGLYDSDTEKIGFESEYVDSSKPNNHKINLFKSTPKYKIEEVKTTGYGELNFVFHNLSSEVKIEAIDKKINSEIIELNKDSIHYWFDPEKEQIEKDYLFKFKVTNSKINKIDTVKCFYKTQKKSKLEISFLKNSLIPSDKIEFNSNSPISNLYKEKISLYKIIVKDTISIPFSLKLKDKKQAVIDFIPEFNTTYLVNILPKGIKDIFGNTNEEVISKKMTPSKSQEYGTFKLQLILQPKHPFFLELYNNKNILVQREYLNTDQFKFNHLLSGKYTLKLLLDENEDGKWNTGDFFLGIQPEKTYIFEKEIEARALWDIKEQWEIIE